MIIQICEYQRICRFIIRGQTGYIDLPGELCYEQRTRMEGGMGGGGGGQE